MWVSCLISTNMLLISWVMLVCHPASLLIHRFLPPRVASWLVSHSQTPLVFEKLLMLFSISHLLDQTYVMLSIRFVNLCMLLLRVIRRLSNIYYYTWKVRLPSVFTLLVVPHYPFMVLLMLIRRGVLMIGSLRVATLSFSAPLSFHGNLASNTLLLTPPLKQNIMH